MSNRRERLLHLLISLTLLLSFAWKAWPNTAKPFSADYVLGFISVTMMVVTIAAWLLLGLRGRARLTDHPLKVAWLCCVTGFAGWAVISQWWAFVRVARPAIAQNAALLIVLVCMLAVVLCACPPPRRWLLAALLMGFTMNLVVGIAQFSVQHELGLSVLGEPRSLNPQKSGISVVQSGDIRLLRPHGLFPHPNIFAGAVLIGLCALLPLLLDIRRRMRMPALLLYAVGVWGLWLSFSRGAWLAFALSACLCGVWVLRSRYRSYLIAPVLITLLISAVFIGIYRPFLTARVTIQDENTEQRSLSDRLVYSEIALEAVQQAPLQGMGAGNFAWYSAHYLKYRTDFDLRGGNVHQVALMLLSELGIVGFVLFGGVLTLPLAYRMGRLWRDPLSPVHLAWFAGAAGLALVGFVDQYMITLPQMMTLWWALIALNWTD